MCGVGGSEFGPLLDGATEFTKIHSLAGEFKSCN